MDIARLELLRSLVVRANREDLRIYVEDHRMIPSRSRFDSEPVFRELPDHFVNLREGYVLGAPCYLFDRFLNLRKCGHRLLFIP